MEPEVTLRGFLWIQEDDDKPQGACCCEASQAGANADIGGQQVCLLAAWVSLVTVARLYRAALLN